MPRYFMGGTKYTAYERMMMEPRVPLRESAPKKKKTCRYRKGSREKRK